MSRAEPTPVIPLMQCHGRFDLVPLRGHFDVNPVLIVDVATVVLERPVSART